MTARRVLLITGLSGSGKSCAARTLEDEGFFVVDNLPVALLGEMLALARLDRPSVGDVAVVIDVRNREFLGEFEQALSDLRAAGHEPEVIFFEAGDSTLIRRYSETRRRHPLAREQAGIPEAIALERRLLEKVRGVADRVIDTSGLTPHQLRARFISLIRGEEQRNPLLVRLQSFGFRYGIPLESDMVFDVRFLPNPHFIEELRPLTGLNRPVRSYVQGQAPTQKFLELVQGLLVFLLPHFRAEGKSYLTISVGCTGGRHRSVSLVEELRPLLAGEGLALDVIHRDLDKE